MPEYPRREPVDDVTFWGVLRCITLVLLLIHAYFGIGIGVYEVTLRRFDARCGTTTYRDSGGMVAAALFWPAQLVARAVIIASRQPASACGAY